MQFIPCIGQRVANRQRPVEVWVGDDFSCLIDSIGQRVANRQRPVEVWVGDDFSCLIDSIDNAVPLNFIHYSL